MPPHSGSGRMIRILRGLVSRLSKPREGDRMADKIEDLDIPKMLARTAPPAAARVPTAPTPIPPRAVEAARPGTDSAKAAASGLSTARPELREPRTMVVGR